MNRNTQARKHMIESQLLTNGISDPAVINVFETTPREDFLPADFFGHAYTDRTITIDHGEGRFALSPLMTGLLIQALALKPDDVVLNLADETGYTTALMAPLCSTVVAVPSRTAALKQAQDKWHDSGLCNITVVAGNIADGFAKQAPYDAILLNGALPEEPDSLLKQLSKGGRLACVITPPDAPTGAVMVFEKIGDREYERRIVHDASVPYIPSFKPGVCFAL